MNKVLNIGYFYHDLLNLYGDSGNIEILISRAKQKGIEVHIFNISTQDDIGDSKYKDLNLIFMGGGPDSGQKLVYGDLKNNKAAFLKDYIESGKVGLYICGAYQLLGNYYKAADGSILEGLGIFDLYTVSFGDKKPRCIGNTVAQLSSKITADPLFIADRFGDELVGFENHGGRTYLGEKMTPFARVKKGNGNNSEDGFEGGVYKNSIGTYFHGPILARNAHFADYLINKALSLTPNEVAQLPQIDDSLVLTAHTASKKLKQ